MERSVSVNGTFAGDEQEPWEAPSTLPASGIASPPRPSKGEDQGPCLYLGPSGQRCDRRAIEGGFCLQHQPGGARKIPSGRSARRAMALGIAFAVLWPILDALLRELIRWLR